MVRFKNRYFTVEVNPTYNDSALSLNEYVLQKAITAKVQQLHGDFGVAAIKSGFLTKYCNKKTRIALIRTRHGPHRLLASSLPFVTKLENDFVSLRILYTGATLRQCYKFVKRHQKMQLDKLWSMLRTDEERKEMEKAVMTFTIMGDVAVT